MILTYTISDSLEVAIFVEGETIPFIYQPYYPDKKPFEDLESAENWAKNFIIELTVIEE